MNAYGLAAICSSLAVVAFAHGCTADEPRASPYSFTEPTDAASVVEAAARDARPVSTGESHPCIDDISSFQPSWKAPSSLTRAICSVSQVDAIVACSFDDQANPTFCDVINNDKANDACAQCLFTASTAKSLGPIVIAGNQGSLNVAGCIANADGNVTDDGCGAKVQAAMQCSNEACDANCPAEDQGPGAKEACIERALANGCAKYAEAAKCQDALVAPGGPAEACVGGTTFLEAAKILGKLFCTAPADGGADAPDSADATSDAESDAPDDG